MNQFNQEHSSDRMTVDHGVRAMKKWGAIRGRADIRLFENNEIFEYC